MKKLIYLIIASFLLNLSIQAQGVIVVAGEHTETSTFSASWTIGEGFTETLEGSDYIITQGLHQTNLTVTAINEPTRPNFNIKAFPNPTNDFVKLTVEVDNPEDYNYALYDLTGKLLQKESLEGIETTIKTESLLPSTYILKVMDNKEVIQNFKIVKQ